MRKLVLPTIAAFAVLAAACGNKTEPAAPAATVQAPVTVGSYKESVQKLYIAYFGRPADVDGLGSFQRQLAAINAPTDIQELTSAYKTNPAVRNLVDSLDKSPESAALYSGDNAQFVTAIFKNILGREPQPSGLAFWQNAIDSGALTRASASLSIMAGALANNTPAGIADAKLINNRVAAASHFTDTLISTNSNAYSGKEAATAARGMLATVTSSTEPQAYQTSATTLASQLPRP